MKKHRPRKDSWIKKWNRSTTSISVDDSLDGIFGKVKRSKTPFKMTVRPISSR